MEGQNSLEPVSKRGRHHAHAVKPGQARRRSKAVRQELRRVLKGRLEGGAAPAWAPIWGRGQGGGTPLHCGETSGQRERLAEPGEGSPGSPAPFRAKERGASPGRSGASAPEPGALRCPRNSGRPRVDSPGPE